MPLLPDAWPRVEVHHLPFTWLTTGVGELFDQATQSALAENFPTESYERRSADSRTSDKSYRNYSRVLHAPGSDTAADLPEIWAELLAELLAPAYRKTVADVLGVPAPDELEVRLARHAPGDWLGPHTDRADKLFSHVFYLNAGWQRDWGGCLQILGSDDPHDLVAEVVPELGATALILRSDSSWHQVGRVAPGVDRERASLLVHGLN
jgi:Rps23 Pro-64 3,4-dihydroxylase Tpa1-like proline 4-hydroxylase